MLVNLGEPGGSPHVSPHYTPAYESRGSRICVTYCARPFRLRHSNSVTCPQCQLESPPRSLRCDCGYLFNDAANDPLASNQARPRLLNKISNGPFVEQWLFLTIVCIPIGGALSFKSLREYGIVGGAVILLFGSLVAGLVATAKWALYRKIWASKPPAKRS